jgi:large subunit ribosomal protein L3
MAFILGRKLGMTQIFDEKGKVYPVTVIEAGPCPIIYIRTNEKEGYNALQIGFGNKRAKVITRPQRGHLKKAGIDIPLVLTPEDNPKLIPSILKEFRTDDVTNYQVGAILSVEIFEKGQKVDIRGTTKGKGYQSVIKRWHFSGGPDAHGSMTKRKPGAIGQCASPGRVIKGKKLGGRTGHVTKTVQNLIIIDVDKDKNLLLVKGSVPGATNSLVEIRSA